MIRILIVDDQNLVQQGIKSLLERDREFKIIGTLKDGRETIKQITQLNPDVVLLDIEMPGMDGITTTKYISRVSPKTKVIILSSHEDKKYITQALIAGAKGYLLKNSLMTDLKQAIVAANNGYSQIDSRLLAKVFNRQNIKVKPDPANEENELVKQANLDNTASSDLKIDRATEELSSLVAENQPNSWTKESDVGSEMTKEKKSSQTTSDIVKIEGESQPALPHKSERDRQKMPTIPRPTNLTTAIEKTSIEKYKPTIDKIKSEPEKSARTKYLDKIFYKPQFLSAKPKVRPSQNQLTQWIAKCQSWVKRQSSEQNLWWILGLMILGVIVAIVLDRIMTG